MKITKMAMVALVTAGLSLGMVACSSEDDDVKGQDQTTVSESVTEDSDDLDHDDEGEDAPDQDDDGEDVPDPPTEVTGFINDEIEHVADYHQIPIEYLNGILDGSVPSDSEYIGDGMGPTYYYDSVDLVMMIGTDGEVKELGPASSALGYNDEFTPREGIYYESPEGEGGYSGYDLY